MRVVQFRGKWYAYWREGGITRRTALRATSREDADQRIADLRIALRRKVSTIREIVEAYLTDKAGIASIANVRFATKPLLPIFGHLRPDQIDRSLCRAYAARRRRAGVKDGTVIKELGVLKAALRWQDHATPAVIEMPPTPPPRSRHLAREQYRVLRDEAKQTPHLWAFVVLAYTTAGRASAILELTWDRVDFKRGQIALGLGESRSKGRATVPMTDSAREMLEEIRRGALTDYVVEYGGKPVRSVKNAFAKAAARAGVPWCTPHVLRHTAAVHMAESGVPMEEISQFLGHSTTAVTFRVYARFGPGYLRRAASALE